MLFLTFNTSSLYQTNNSIYLKTTTNKSFYRHHGFRPLSVSSLQQLDFFWVIADLDQVPHSKLCRGCHRGRGFIGGGGGSTRGVYFGENSWVKCPPVKSKLELTNIYTIESQDARKVSGSFFIIRNQHPLLYVKINISLNIYIHVSRSPIVVCFYPQALARVQ